MHNVLAHEMVADRTYEADKICHPIAIIITNFAALQWNSSIPIIYISPELSTPLFITP